MQCESSEKEVAGGVGSRLAGLHLKSLLLLSLGFGSLWEGQEEPRSQSIRKQKKQKDMVNRTRFYPLPWFLPLWTYTRSITPSSISTSILLVLKCERKIIRSYKPLWHFSFTDLF